MSDLLFNFINNAPVEKLEKLLCELKDDCYSELAQKIRTFIDLKV